MKQRPRTRAVHPAHRAAEGGCVLVALSRRGHGLARAHDSWPAQIRSRPFRMLGLDARARALLIHLSAPSHAQGGSAVLNGANGIDNS